jgi:hypothetical protein
MWTARAECLVTYPFNNIDENLLDDLYDLLSQAMVSPTRLAAPILRALVHVPDFPRIKAMASEGPKVKSLNYRELAGSLSRIPLLIKLMGLCNFDDLNAERMLTNLRRAMILQLPDDDANCLTFSAALALHCFANEYVFICSDEEKVAVGGLERKV